MKRKTKSINRIISILLFIFFFICFGSFLLKTGSRFYNVSSSRNSSKDRIEDEDYDESLSRLNSLTKLTDYCDSFYSANYETRTYPGVVSEVLRKKFYHGYSYYDVSDNAIGVLLEPIVQNGATAIVVPEDIVKYPNAACSQQSIVAMQILKKKGYEVRKVSMFDAVRKSGHFAYEVYFNGGWHFYDSDQEPDAAILRKYNRPSAAFLAANPEITLEAYRNRKDPQLFKRLLITSKPGPVNQFPAPNARLYQLITKFLSYFGWLIIGSIILLRYFVLSKKRISILQKEKKLQTFFQPVHSNS